jgi:hypothetical protein
MLENPFDRLDTVLAAVLRPVGERAPADEFRTWADLLAGIQRFDWAAVPGDAEALQRRISARLTGRASAPGGLDDWSRAIGLTTALAVLRGVRLGCTGLGPWLAGAGDLYQALGPALNSLYDGEAARAPAGPLAFAWVTKAALPFEPGFRNLLRTAPRAYFEELRAGLATPCLLQPTDDRVLAYLRARLAAPSSEPAAVPPRRDRTFGERVCALFNGDPFRWSRSGTLRLLGATLAAVTLALGIALCAAGRATTNHFFSQHTQPYLKAFDGAQPQSTAAP